MNIQRLSEILEAYGGDSQRWPEAETAAALELCAKEPEARRMMEDALALDVMLDRYDVPIVSSTALIHKIESEIQLPRNMIDQFIEWLLPDRGSIPSLVRPALIACLPVMLGIWIGAGETKVDELSLDEEYAVLAVFTPSEGEDM